MALQYLAAISFPEIDPVAFSLGPLAVRWYGIAYVIGILLGWFYARRLVDNGSLWREGAAPITKQQVDDFIFYAAIGIVVGGRIGYVFFYEPERFVENPLWLFAVNEGGMSFHGGLIGTTVAMIFFAWKNKLSAWNLFDLVSAVVPIGLFFGRIANFINGELWGRITDVPWAMVFPAGGPFTRHPNQLYEAALEGIVLLLVLMALIYGAKALRRPGLVTGVFIGGYGLFRIFIEFFREPDPQLGYLYGGWLTMGMLLSLPMVVIGLWAALRAVRKSGATQ